MFDNGQLSLYIDGNQVGSEQTNVNSINLESTDPNNFIGAGFSGGQQSAASFFDGQIDNLAFWDIPLDENAVNYYRDSTITGQEEGLISYWSFNSGAGDIAYDRSGGQSHGDINGATWGLPATPGENNSLSFDGENDRVIVENISDNIVNSDASLMGWFNINDYDDLNPIFGFRNYPNDYCSMYAVMGTNGTIETMVYGNLQSFIQGPHEENQWYHIALIYNGQTFKTYLDGDLVASVDTPEPIFECTGQDLIIGAMQIGDFESLNGIVDDVSLWNISLDQETIQSNMNTELIGNEEGLIGYWNFNEGEGPELIDLSGNGNNCLLYTSPSPRDS